MNTTVMPPETAAAGTPSFAFRLGMYLVTVFLLVLPFVWVTLMDWTVLRAPIFWFRAYELTPNFFYCWPAAWICFAVGQLAQEASLKALRRVILSFLLMLGAVCLGTLSSNDLERKVLHAIGLNFPPAPPDMNVVIKKDIMPFLLNEFTKPRLTDFTELAQLDNRMSLVSSKVCEHDGKSDSSCKKLKIAVRQDGEILGYWLTNL